MKNTIFALLLVGIVSTAQAISFFSVVMEEWEMFKLEHGKKYNSDVEEQFRMKIYTENKVAIASHNQLYHQGKKSFKLGINKYSDMLPTEITSTMNGFRGYNTSKFADEAVSFIEADDDVELPKKVNWADKGAVTPVKDQGQCGSCWAFSTTGSLEGQHFRKTGKLVSLSEQNLVDCSSSYGNQGCNGGLMDNAFKYIRDNHGIDTEESYPYEAQDDDCHFKPNNVGADDKGFVDIRQGSEKALKKAVATIGPIAVAIDASHPSFQSYDSGVYDEPDCDPEALDHGVLLVGYGTAEDGTEYWLVKNSWGTSWGEDGYIRMRRNNNNMCGIASSASYPLV